MLFLSFLNNVLNLACLNFAGLVFFSNNDKAGKSKVLAKTLYAVGQPAQRHLHWTFKAVRRDSPPYLVSSIGLIAPFQCSLTAKGEIKSSVHYRKACLCDTLPRRGVGHTQDIRV